VARAAWAVLVLLGLTLAGGLLLWRLGMRGWLLPACIAFAMSFQPLYAELSRGQAYTPMLLALIVAWSGLQSRRAGLLGGALAFALLIRIVGLLFWPWLLLTRQWRALAWGLGITGGVCLVLLIKLPDAWLATLPWLQRMTSGAQTTVTAYQTLQSWSGHLFTYDAYWNPEPVIHAPLLAAWSSRLASGTMVVASLYAAWRATRADLAFALLVLAGLIVSPVSQGYHYTLALLPIVLLAAWLADRHARWLWAWLGAGAFLIAANLPYQAAALRDGAWALLAYPKLYGALLLWGLAWWGLRRPVPL
jgi:alpha-1,2-mannosyltransferase